MTERERLAVAVCEAVGGYYTTEPGIDKCAAHKLREVAIREGRAGWDCFSDWLHRIADAYERYAASAEPAAEPAWKKGDRVRVVARPTVPEAYRAERGATDSDRDVAGEVGTILRAGTSSPPLPEWYVEFGEGLPRRRYLWECNLERLPADCCQSCGGPLGDKEVAL